MLFKCIHFCKAAEPPPVSFGALTPWQTPAPLGWFLPSPSLLALPSSPTSSSSSSSLQQQISTLTELWQFSLLPILSHLSHNCCHHRQVHIIINALLNFISHLEPCRWCSLIDTVVISTIGMAINNEYYPSHVSPSLPTQ